MVEPAPQDMEVLRGCGFESHCSPPAGPTYGIMGILFRLRGRLQL